MLTIYQDAEIANSSYAASAVLFHQPDDRLRKCRFVAALPRPVALRATRLIHQPARAALAHSVRPAHVNHRQQEKLPSVGGNNVRRAWKLIGDGSMQDDLNILLFPVLRESLDQCGD